MKFIMIGRTGAEDEFKSLVEYAEKPEHWYRPPGDIPGDSAPHIRRVQVMDALSGQEVAVRVVFTITEHPSGKTFRHASLSVNQGTELPDPATVLVVCLFLGFKGTLDDWAIELHNHVPNVVAIAQEWVPPHMRS